MKFIEWCLNDSGGGVGGNNVKDSGKFPGWGHRGRG